MMAEMLMVLPLCDFVSNVAESVVAGLIVLAVAFVLVERQLQLRDRAAREQEAEKERRRTRVAVLTAVHGELESDAAQWALVLEELPHAEERLIYPLFDVSMWPTVSSSGVLTGLKPETTEALLHIYNRMATANEQYGLFVDMHQGRTGLLVHMMAATSFDDPVVKDTLRTFYEHRRYTRTIIERRLKELKPHLDAAIDVVEVELGLRSEHKAGQRTYVAERAPESAD